MHSDFYRPISAILGLMKSKLVMVYNANETIFRAMSKDWAYFFQIEPFSEGGIGPRSAVIETK